MPQNKKQHFVPKFILKHFAVDEDEKQINIFNIKKHKIIRKASLRDQCYRAYFYGKGPLESHLSEVEGTLNTFIDHLIDGTNINGSFETLELVVLMTTLQKARTVTAMNEVNFLSDKLAKLVLYNRINPDVLTKIDISVENAPAQNISLSLTMSPILFDMKHFLVINKTRIPFVVSDNPVLHTNWFCHARMPGRPSGGTARSGLQVFMPLTPRYGVLLHDQSVYNANCCGHTLTVNEKDVLLLNELQFLNALENVYFSAAMQEEIMLSCCTAERGNLDAAQFRRFDKVEQGTYVQTDKSVFDPPSKGVIEELIHFKVNELQKDMRLSCIKLRSKPRFYDNKSLGSPQRDPIWTGIVNEFVSYFEKQHLKMEDFWRFVEGHPAIDRVGPWLARLERASGQRTPWSQ